ncbi:unnamed protein product [Rhodiola kirilowii]
MSDSVKDKALYNALLLTLFIIAPPTFISLRFLQAPYGKHHRPGWGPSLPASLAWFLMESPTLWLTLYLFPRGRHAAHLKSLILILPCLLHYFNRTILYPLRLLRQRSVGPYPMAFGFNCLNVYLQARSLSKYEDYEAGEWFWLRFVVRLVVVGFGMRMNVKSDALLVGLKSGGGGYKIPRGGWFEAVSCPNYLGEIVEWLGWALMTWSWAGLGVWMYTCARTNHMWYLDKFKGEYPNGRKAVIPYLY